MAALVAAALALAPPLGLAQPAPSAANLPRLGDAAADELSPAMERRIGEQIVRDMHRERVIADDPEITDWLNDFAERLASTTTAAGHSLELFLVRDGTLNAFALPGGFIGVHSGLIVAAQSESELASVVAHEIGHVTQRHIARMLARDRQTSVVMLASLVLAALAASSNPQAAMGVASLGSTIARQQMLGFSRDAEREADRIGLDMLIEGGYDANGMVGFLGRLQQAGRLYENGAPDYLRTHPVTSERMADIQNRLRDTRYRQRPDSTEFLLVQARLRALADGSVDALARAAATFERQLRNRTVNEAAGWFGLATVRNAQRDPDGARAALAEVRSRIGPHPFVERLAAQIELDAGLPGRARAIAEAALAQQPSNRALIRVRAQALLAAGRHRDAADALGKAVEIHRGDATLWRLLAEAWSGAGDPARAHRASAEHFALLGGLPAAIEQLRRARQAGTLDFYTGSQVDARLRELQQEYLREREERERQ
ncbi:M48 family metalloprotease [Burkholderiaceae bacterium FT117]|uniref:M48 family metalloprotease n=1 Tax=Zeimonas sediminis TaxID=2944268 RepID=UPI0023431BE5|nr:M48 family metalloprotease [Zeimonas sediminis]MCM5570659.1 M48 family metalloprotease [Zeimonas sediminis]